MQRDSRVLLPIQWRSLMWMTSSIFSANRALQSGQITVFFVLWKSLWSGFNRWLFLPQAMKAVR